jgi:hypothetical protein
VSEQLTPRDLEILRRLQRLGEVREPYATEALATIFDMDISGMNAKLRGWVECDPPLVVVIQEAAPKVGSWPQYELAPAGLEMLEA